MIKSRIDINGNFICDYSQSYIEVNSNNIIDGVLVSEWFFASTRYNGGVEKPVFTDEAWVEGASVDELQNAENLQLLKTKKEVRDKRNALLRAGVIVKNPNGDESYWFDKAALNDFITNLQLTEKLGGTQINWEASDRNWYAVSLADGYVLSATAAQMIQQIYIDN